VKIDGTLFFPKTSGTLLLKTLMAVLKLNLNSLSINYESRTVDEVYYFWIAQRLSTVKGNAISFNEKMNAYISVASN
jgi:hypothetical protein